MDFWTNILLFFSVLGVFLYRAIHAADWFVSRQNGTVSTGCGSEITRPCRTLFLAVGQLQQGDVIYIDGTGTSSDPYPCELESTEQGLVISVGVTLKSYNSRAFMACRNTGLQFFCPKTEALAEMNCSVVMSGLTFFDGSLSFIDFSFTMNQCSFINIFVNAVSVSFEWNSKGYVAFNRCTFENNRACVLKITADKMNLTIMNSTFAWNKLAFPESKLVTVNPLGLSTQETEYKVKITNVDFYRNQCRGSNCVEIAPGIEGQLDVVFENVTFQCNEASESVLDFNGSSTMMLSFVRFLNNMGRALKCHGGHDLNLNITNGNFLGSTVSIATGFANVANGGAVYVRGLTGKATLYLSNSSFSNNKATGYGGAIAIGNASSLFVDIEGCSFVENEGKSSGGALAIGTVGSRNWQRNTSMIISNTNFSRNVIWDNYTHGFMDKGGGGAVSIFVIDMWRFALKNNVFSGNKALNLSGSGAIHAYIYHLHEEAILLRCSFINNFGEAWSGTLQLSVLSPLPSLQSRITIQNSTFTENSGNGVYDIVLSQDILFLKSCKFQRNAGGGIYLGNPNSTTAQMRLENSSVSDNTDFRFFIYKGFRSKLLNYTLQTVTFFNNSCGKRGSLFTVSLYDSAHVIRMRETNFVRNFCDMGVVLILAVPSQAPNIEPHTELVLENSEFRDNSGVTESAVTLRNAKVIRINKCKFINNFGNTDGSHLRAELLDSDLRICHSTFYQTKKSEIFVAREEPYNGLMTVTNRGNITIKNSSFISDPVDYFGLPLIIVKGANTVDMDKSVSVQSSYNSLLHLHNFTHTEVDETGMHNFEVTTFSLTSQTCPVGSYTIRRGTAKGLKMTFSTECLTPCPNGAICVFNLSAKPNFWGYPIGERVHFTICPRGYCCPRSRGSCLYDSEKYTRSGCQGNRTGILCGRCEDNFSESIFTPHCVHVEECKDWWLVIIAILCAALMALFLVKKPPVFKLLWTNLIWFLPRKKTKSCRKGSFHHDGVARDVKESSGFLKIVFYFYQIAGVLTVSSYGVDDVLMDNIVLPVVSLMDFRITSKNGSKICPFPGITAQLKALFQLLGVLAILTCILLLYLLHSGLNKLRKRKLTFPSSGPYLGAILEIMLLGYSAATGTAMRLLHCKQINHVPRWFYNANIECYTWWQHASVAGIVVYLLPFILTLFLGSSRLYRGQLTPVSFLLACTFPSVYVLFTMVTRAMNIFRKLPHEKPIDKPRLNAGNSSTNVAESSVFEVLAAPFRRSENDQSLGMIHWESVLIGRRFILILVGNFVAHAFLRSVVLTILCVIILLHHVWRRPFKEVSENVIETISLSTLVVIATLNVGIASYYSTGIEATGLEKDYTRAFLLTEAILLGLGPFLFIIFVAVSLASQLVRLFLLLIKVMRRFISNRKSTDLEVFWDRSEAKPLINAA